MIRTIIAGLLAVVVCPVAVSSTATHVQISNQRRVSFNDGWRFLKS